MIVILLVHGWFCYLGIKYGWVLWVCCLFDCLMFVDLCCMLLGLGVLFGCFDRSFGFCMVFIGFGLLPGCCLVRLL